jgi:hypothetical protein
MKHLKLTMGIEVTAQEQLQVVFLLKTEPPNIRFTKEKML